MTQAIYDAAKAGDQVADFLIWHELVQTEIQLSGNRLYHEAVKISVVRMPTLFELYREGKLAKDAAIYVADTDLSDFVL